MSIRKLFIVLVCALGGLFGCQVAPVIPTSMTTAGTEITASPKPSTPSILLTEVASPTLMPSPSPTIETIVSPTPEVLAPECTSVLTQSLASGGVIGLADTLGVYSFEPPTSTLQKLPDLENWTKPSPDEQWLGHLTFTEPSTRQGMQIEFITPSGIKKSTFALQAGAYPYLGWIDNAKLLVGADSASAGVSSAIVLDVVTGKEQRLSFEPTSVAVNYWPLIYDPSLTRVIYPTLTGFQLNDVQTGVVLTAIESPRTSDVFPAPQWSPDGSQVAVVSASEAMEGELLTISHDGQVNTLLSQVHQLGEFAWSRDGTKIAFWLAFASSKGAKQLLSVIEVNTKSVVTYCIPGQHLILNSSAPAPIWSPDGQQVVVQSYVGNLVGDFNTLIVDFDTATVAKIGDNLAPTFWLKALPPVWKTGP